VSPSPRRALITGASSGIGREFARQLAAHCDEIIITGRHQSSLQEVAAEIQSRSVACDIITADLSTTIGIAQLMETIRQRGPFRYLINNAGFSTLGPFTEQQPVSQEAMVTLHIQATMQLTLAALGGMQPAQSGYIVNVSSLVAVAPFGGLAVYGGTKAFLNNFSTALQQEVASQGVKVQCLCPGYTRTQFHQHPAFEDFDASAVPDKLWMNPDDVVHHSLAALHGPDERVVVIPGKQNQTMIAKILENQLKTFEG
jgi:short-subunit dehydrogenase